MTAVAERTATPMVELRQQLEARTGEFANALPSHIKPAHFQRATLTAISINPKLLNVDRRSLFNALMKCAQDGLIPDGRQAALVIFNSKTGPIAQYLPMVAGYRKLVQQSGEITRFEQAIVYEADEFAYELGDQPFIRHRPALSEDRGKPVRVYSVAEFRGGGLSRDVMSIAEIEKVRSKSRAADEGPWVDWWDEMAKKTIAKRHAKVLPMSNDAAEVLARSDDFTPLAPSSLPAIERRPRLSERLDSIGPAHQPEDQTQTRARRGRQRKPDTDEPADTADTADRVPDGTGELPASELEPLTMPTADYLAGVKDRERGATACLDRNITADPQRLADWQAGFDSGEKA